MDHSKRFVYGMILAIVVLLPFVFSTGFQRNLFVLSLIFAIGALSLDLVLTGMGQFTMGHQAYFALGAYASALLAYRLDVSPFIGFFVGAAVAGLAGLLTGYVALRSNRGVYLAIITLGFSIILLQVFSYFRKITGGPPGISGLPYPVIAIPGLPEFRFNTDLSYYFLTLIFLVLTVYVIKRWKQSRFGRAAKALAENETLSESIGISPLLVHTMTFTLAAAIAGLAGALFAHYLRYATPLLFSMKYMMDFALMLVIGGIGTFGGPIFGAFFIWLLPEFLPFSDKWDLVFKGLILFLFVRFMPQGIYPNLKILAIRLIQRLFRHRKPVFQNSERHRSGE